MAAINDIYKCRFVSQWISGSQVGINVRHWLCTAKVGAGASDLQFAQALDVAVAPLYKALMNNAVTYRGVGVQKIWPLPVLLEISTSANAGAGTVANDMLPPQSCGLISFGTVLAGRHYRGRSYVPFPSEDDQTNGQFSVGYQTRLVALATQLGATFVVGGGGNTNTFIAVVYQRVAHLAQNITTASSHLNVATQRRRSTYGRQNTAPF